MRSASNGRTISIFSFSSICELSSIAAWTVASAGLLVLSQAPYDLGPLATVALVPWLIATHRSGPAQAGIMGLLLGVVYGVAGAPWLFAAFESQGARGAHALFGVLLTALWGKGLVFGFAGWGTQRLATRGRAVRVLGPALLFGLLECWISESRWGLPLLLLGHSQSSVPGVAQLAVATGVPGISVLLFGLNSAIASLFMDDPNRGRSVAGWATAWLALAVGGLPLAQSFGGHRPSDTKALLVVQPNISHARRWEPAYQRTILDKIASVTTRAIEQEGKRPDAILWPENLLTVPTTIDESLGRRLQQLVDDWDVPVVTGLVREAAVNRPGRYRSSVVWWSPRVGPRDALDKVRAIPLVESGRAFWGREVLHRIVGGAARGPKVVEAADVVRALRGEFTLSPLLCFEVLFPRIVARRRDSESVAIVNLADDSWVAGEAVDEQLVAAATFRAIEQRLTLVRVSHGGLSVALDPTGRELASLEPDTASHFVVEVAASPPARALEKAAIVALPLVARWLGWVGWGRRPGAHREEPKVEAAWFPDVDSNHNSQIQSLLSCR